MRREDVFWVDLKTTIKTVGKKQLQQKLKVRDFAVIQSKSGAEATRTMPTKHEQAASLSQVMQLKISLKLWQTGAKFTWAGTQRHESPGTSPTVKTFPLSACGTLPGGGWHCVAWSSWSRAFVPQTDFQRHNAGIQHHRDTIAPLAQTSRSSAWVRAPTRSLQGRGVFCSTDVSHRSSRMASLRNNLNN